MADLTCVRCGQPVLRNREHFTTFERMHWTCFHFEHASRDPDIACGDPSCPARAFDTQPPPAWPSET